MAIVTIPSFDPSKIPSVSDEATFHANATYVFSHMASEVIPKWNAGITEVNTALAGASTIVASVGALVDGTTPAGDAARLGAELPDFYRNASNLNAGTLAFELLPALTKPGHFVNINSGGVNVSLPAGGTWFWSYTGLTGAGVSYIHDTGLSAGGTIIFPGAGSTNIARGFALRVK